jgi:hypothetical protein
LLLHTLLDSGFTGLIDLRYSTAASDGDSSFEGEQIRKAADGLLKAVPAPVRKRILTRLVHTG